MGTGLIIDHLSDAITHAAAPAFFLGAVTGLVSIILTRLNGVMAELTEANRRGEGATPAGRSLLRRARMLHSAVSYAVIAGISTTTLLGLTFVAAFVRLEHLYLAGALFMGSASLTGLSLLKFYQEVRYELSVLKAEMDKNGHSSDA